MHSWDLSLTLRPARGYGARVLIRVAPLGLPQPVTRSNLAIQEKSPLLPVKVSRASARLVFEDCGGARGLQKRLGESGFQ